MKLTEEECVPYNGMFLIILKCVVLLSNHWSRIFYIKNKLVIYIFIYFKTMIVIFEESPLHANCDDCNGYNATETWNQFWICWKNINVSGVLLIDPFSFIKRICITYKGNISKLRFFPNDPVSIKLYYRKPYTADSNINR